MEMEQGAYRLLAACAAGDVVLVERAWHAWDKEERNVDVRGETGRTPLHLAASCGSTAVVEWLLERGGDRDLRDAIGWTALHHAANSGCVEAVEALLQGSAVQSLFRVPGPGALPSFRETQVDRSVLTLDSACHGLAVGSALVGAAIPTEEVLTPLHVAAERGHVAVVRLMLPLMGQGDVDSSAWGGCAPLHDAAGHGHTIVVKCLLDAAADPELSDEGGWGALHYASSEGHNDTVECLLRAGARTDKTDRNGCTPIHYAAGEGYVNVLTSLVQAGAHVDAQALSGWTPLHYAAQSGRYKTARALLDAGASRSICAAQGGQLAKAVAMEHGHSKVVSLLKDYVRQSAKLVMALQRLAWARCQISCKTLTDNGPAYILSAELVQQVTRRYKHAPPSNVVRRAEAESHLLWQLKGVQALERRGLADAKKQAGNQFYREKQFDKALKCYSEALAIDPTNHLYYCNLSAATATLGLWEESASAARRCLQLSPGFVKAHIRLATAEMNLGRYDEAVAAVEVGLQQQSNGSRSNPSLRRLLSELREKDPAIQFARARVARREQLQKPRRNSVSTVGSVSTVPDTYDGGKNEYGGGAGGSQASHDSGGAAALAHRHSIDRENYYQAGGDARSVGGESVAFSDLAVSDIASQAGADSIEDSLEADGELAYLQEMPSEEEDEQDDLQAFGDGDTSDGGFSQGARSRLSDGGFFQPEPERSGAVDTLERHEAVRRGWGAGSTASEGGYSVSDAGDMGTVQEQGRGQPSVFDSRAVTLPPDLHLDDQDGIAAGGEAATVTAAAFSGADLPRIGWGASSYAGSDAGSQGGSSYAGESGGAVRDPEQDSGALRATSDAGSDVGFETGVSRRGWGASSNASVASEGGSSYAGELGTGGSIGLGADWETLE